MVGGVRSSRPEVFLRKGVLKICSKFTGEHPCRTAISIKLLCNLFKSYFGMCVLLHICCIFQNNFSKEDLWIAASGGVFKFMKNDHFLVSLAAWVLFLKFLGRKRSSLY